MLLTPAPANTTAVARSMATRAEHEPATELRHQDRSRPAPARDKDFGRQQQRHYSEGYERGPPG